MRNNQKSVNLKRIGILAASVIMFFAFLLSAVFTLLENSILIGELQSGFVSADALNWEGSVEEPRGQGTTLNFTKNTVASDSSFIGGNTLNNTTRTYYLRVGEVMSDVIEVINGCYMWDPMLSSDILGQFTEYSKTQAHRFKYYARIQGRTTGVLKYARPYTSTYGDTDKLAWYSITFVFIVVDTPTAGDVTHSPVTNTATNKFMLEDQFEIPATSVASNPSGQTGKIKILAASVFYPVAVDATPYAASDMGFLADITPLYGTNFTRAVDRITVKMYNPTYRSFGIELLVMNENGWTGLVYAYFNDFKLLDKNNQPTLNYNALAQQNLTYKVEDRTLVKDEAKIVDFSITNYLNESSDWYFTERNISYKSTFSTRLDTSKYSLYFDGTGQPKFSDTGMKDYTYQNVRHEMDGMSFRGKTSVYRGLSKNYFDVVLQGSYQAKDYLEQPYYYCYEHGAVSRSLVVGATHIPVGLATGYYCAWYGFDTTGATHNGHAAASKPCSTYLADRICDVGHLIPATANKTETVEGAPYLVCKCGETTIHKLQEPVYSSCSLEYYNDGSGCYMNASYPHTPVTIGGVPQNYKESEPYPYDTAYNFNLTPFYFATGNDTVGFEDKFPTSRGAKITFNDKNIQTLNLNTGVLAAALGNLQADNGFSSTDPNVSYTEIENIYAFDKAYMSVGLTKDRNNSYIKVSGIHDTTVDSPKYIVLTVTNVINGQRYPRLVSIEVTVNNYAAAGNYQYIRETNLAPRMVAETNITGSMAFQTGGTHTYCAPRGTLVSFKVSDLAKDPDGDIVGFYPATDGLLYDDPTHPDAERGPLGALLQVGASQKIVNQYLTVPNWTPPSMSPPNPVSFNYSLQINLSGKKPTTNKRATSNDGDYLKFYVKIIDQNGGEYFAPIKVCIYNNAPLPSSPNNQDLAFTGVKGSSTTFKVGKDSTGKLFVDSVAYDPDDDDIFFALAGDTDLPFAITPDLNVPVLSQNILSRFNDGSNDAGISDYVDCVRIDKHTVRLTFRQLRRDSTYYLKVYDEYGMYEYIPIKITITNLDPIANPNTEAGMPGAVLRTVNTVRGGTKDFYAGVTYDETIALDPDGDYFGFASSGDIIFDDSEGSSSIKANENFTVIRNTPELFGGKNYTTSITIKFNTVMKDAIFYLKVEDANAQNFEYETNQYRWVGVKYISIKVTVNNQAPTFSDNLLQYTAVPLTIDASPSAIAVNGGVNASYRKITTSPSPAAPSASDAFTVFSIGKDFDNSPAPASIETNGRPADIIDTDFLSGGLYGDCLTLTVSNWSSQSTYFGYQLVDPVGGLRLVNGVMTQTYKSIVFTAKRRTVSQKVTIVIFDGYDSKSIDIFIRVLNSPVAQQATPAAFAGYVGDTKTYTAIGLAKDFDAYIGAGAGNTGIDTGINSFAPNTSIDISNKPKYDVEKYKIMDYRISGNYGLPSYITDYSGATTKYGYIEVSLTDTDNGDNSVLTVKASARSTKHGAYTGAGHFALEILINDFEGNPTDGAGIWIPIDITILNSTPIATDLTLGQGGSDTIAIGSDPYEDPFFGRIYAGSNIPLISAYKLATDNDCGIGAQLGFNVNDTSLNYYDDWSDRLRIVSLQMLSGSAVNHSPYASISLVDDPSMSTTMATEKKSIKIDIHKWSPVPLVFYAEVVDRAGKQTIDSIVSNTTVRVRIEIILTNTPPKYRYTNAFGGIGSKSNPYDISLSLDDISTYKESSGNSYQDYFKPYDLVDDIDIPDTLQGTNEATFQSYIDQNTGFPKTAFTGDGLSFSTVDGLSFENNSFNYISFTPWGSVQSSTSPSSWQQMLYRMTAFIRNTDNRNVIVRVRIIDVSLNYIDVYLRINVLNSRPKLKSSAPGEGSTAQVLKVVPETNDVSQVTISKTKVWETPELVYDPDTEDQDNYSYTFNDFKIAVISKEDYISAGNTLLPANDASQYIKITISPSYIQVEALKTTKLLPGKRLWVGFTVNDNAKFTPLDSDILWIAITIENSAAVQTPSSGNLTILNKDVTATNTYDIMIRAKDSHTQNFGSGTVTNVVHNGVTYTSDLDSTKVDGAAVRPLIILATDPDEDDIVLKRVGNSETGYSVKVSNDYTDNYTVELFNALDSLPVMSNINNKDWFYIVKFNKLGTSAIEIHLSDDVNDNAPTTFTVTFTVSNIKINEKYAQPGFNIEPITVDYKIHSTDAHIGELRVFDLYDFIAPKNEGDSAWLDRSYLRLAKNDIAVKMPPVNPSGNENPYTNAKNNMVYVKNSSIRIKEEDQKYIQILGGAVVKDLSDDPVAHQTGICDLHASASVSSPIDSQLYAYKDDDNSKKEVRYCRCETARGFAVRGLQRTIKPIEITVFYNVFDGNDFYVPGVRKTDFDGGNRDSKGKEYIDLVNDERLSFTFTVTVANSQLKDASLTTDENNSTVKIHLLRDLTSVTKRATITTTAIASSKSTVTLKLDDDDTLDTKIINFNSIDRGSGNNPGQVQSGVAGFEKRYTYDNNNIKCTLATCAKCDIGVNHKYTDFFDVVSPVSESAQSKDSQYIYLNAKSKTTILPGGYFPLYMMIYDDYAGSSKLNGITDDDLLAGNNKILGYVSRIIVCVRVFIGNSAPVPISSTITDTRPEGDSTSRLLTSLFTDNDMQLAPSNSSYWDIAPPDSSIDRIKSIKISFYEDAEIESQKIIDSDGVQTQYVSEYLKITLGKYKLSSKEDPDIYAASAGAYSEPEAQIIKVLVLKNIMGDVATRFKRFSIEITDDSGESAQITALIYIPNTSPVQDEQYKNISLNVGQTVRFSLIKPATAEESYNKDSTATDKGIIRVATDKETNELDLYIEELVNAPIAFAMKYSENIEITKNASGVFTVRAAKATRAGKPVVLTFTVNDGDGDQNTCSTLCTFNITINSRPPELRRVDGSAVYVQEKAIGIRLSQNESVSQVLFDDIAFDSDPGDYLTIADRPKGIAPEGQAITKFTNADVVVDPKFTGNANFLINGINTNQNNYISLSANTNPGALVIKALNVYSYKETNGNNTVVFYLVDTAFNAVKITLNIIVENDNIKAKSPGVINDLNLNGVGSSMTIVTSDYLTGDLPNSTADGDYNNTNAFYSVYVKEYVDASTTRIIAQYVVGSGSTSITGFQYIGKGSFTNSVCNYFDIDENSGISQGRRLVFVSNKRTPKKMRIDIEIVKGVWKVQNNSATLLPRSESTVVLRFNVNVANTKAVVERDNLPKEIGGRSEINLKINESTTRVLFNGATPLMSDLDNDALTFNQEKGLTVLNDPKQDFKRCLDVRLDNNILIIRAKDKMYDIDKTGQPFVTRTISLTIYDEGGLIGESLNIPVTLTNSAPVIINRVNVFTVLKDKYITSVVDGEEISKVPLNTIIYDADMSGNNESFTLERDLLSASQKGGITLYNVDNLNEELVNISCPADYSYFIIKGLSNKRNAVTKDLEFYVTDGSGQRTPERIVFRFVVGNSAPEAVTSPQPVVNILGGNVSRARRIYLNESDHNAYYATSKNPVPFVHLFSDINGDSFRFSNYINDISIDNPDDPLVKIEVNGAIDKKGFIINTIAGKRGTTNIYIRGYDSDPNDETKNTLSVITTLTVNVSEVPSSLVKQTIPIFNKRSITILPTDVYGKDEFGNENSIGYYFTPDSFKIAAQKIDYASGEAPYEEIIDIIDGSVIKAKREGLAKVTVELVIGEDIFIETIDIDVSPNNKPNQHASYLYVSTNDDNFFYDTSKSKYGIYRLYPNKIVNDVEDGDEIKFSSFKSSNPAIVDGVVSPDGKYIDLYCKAGGEVKFTVYIEDAVNPYPYDVIYTNSDLPELGFFAGIVADMAINPAKYIWPLIIMFALLILILSVYSTVKRNQQMRAEVEAIMVNELNIEEQLLQLAGVSAMQANIQNQLGMSEQLAQLNSTMKEDILALEGGEDMLLELENEEAALLLDEGKTYEKGEIADLDYNENTYYSLEQLDEDESEKDEKGMKIENKDSNAFKLNALKAERIDSKITVAQQLDRMKKALEDKAKQLADELKQENKKKLINALANKDIDEVESPESVAKRILTKAVAPEKVSGKKKKKDRETYTDAVKKERNIDLNEMFNTAEEEKDGVTAEEHAEEIKKIFSRKTPEVSIDDLFSAEEEQDGEEEAVEMKEAPEAAVEEVVENTEPSVMEASEAAAAEPATEPETVLEETKAQEEELLLRERERVRIDKFVKKQEEEAKGGAGVSLMDMIMAQSKAKEKHDAPSATLSEPVMTAENRPETESIDDTEVELNKILSQPETKETVKESAPVVTSRPETESIDDAEAELNKILFQTEAKETVKTPAKADTSVKTDAEKEAAKDAEAGGIDDIMKMFENE